MKLIKANVLTNMDMDFFVKNFFEDLLHFPSTLFPLNDTFSFGFLFSGRIASLLSFMILCGKLISSVKMIQAP